LYKITSNFLSDPHIFSFIHSGFVFGLTVRQARAW